MRVLLAIDGGARGEAALQELLARDWPAGTEVRVVSVAHPWPAVHDPFFLGQALHQITRGDECRRAGVDAEVVAGRIAQARPDLQVSQEVPEGTPEEAIPDAAIRFAADLVIAGERARGPLARRFFGSVARTIAERTPCPVEIVPVASGDHRPAPGKSASYPPLPTPPDPRR